MTKIVDIHGHYVFRVDDGAETLPMALEMIHSACRLFCNIDFSNIIT